MSGLCPVQLLYSQWWGCRGVAGGQNLCGLCPVQLLYNRWWGCRGVAGGQMFCDLCLVQLLLYNQLLWGSRRTELA